MVERVRLASGRRLAYAQYGPRDGLPLFYFHGVPSSRLEPLAVGLAELAERVGARLIAPDRPGIGRSDPLPGRRLGDWPADVSALADHLGVSRFAVMGCSGGGPYALACAERIPERVLAAAVISSPARFDVPALTQRVPSDNLRYLRLSLQRPVVHAVVTAAMGLLAHVWPDSFLRRAAAALPPPDAEVMAVRGAPFARAVAEGTRQALRGGATRDTALMVGSWDIDPALIRMPVLIWHGEDDVNAPVAMGRYLAERIPDARATFLPGEGHFSVFSRHMERIAMAVLDEAAPR